MKSHTFQKSYAKHPGAIFLHAEISSIKNALNKKIDLDIISNSTLYICRQKIISGEWVSGLSKPCNGCQKCIKDFNIKKIIFSLDGNGYDYLF